MKECRKPNCEAEIKRKLEPIARIIEGSENGLESKVVTRMLKNVHSNLNTLTMYFPIYEEERTVGKNKPRIFISMLKK